MLNLKKSCRHFPLIEPDDIYCLRSSNQVRIGKIKNGLHRSEISKLSRQELPVLILIRYKRIKSAKLSDFNEQSLEVRMIKDLLRLLVQIIDSEFFQNVSFASVQPPESWSNPEEKPMILNYPVDSFERCFGFPLGNIYELIKVAKSCKTAVFEHHVDNLLVLSFSFTFH